MTDDEVIDLLTLMASFDRRTVGDADADSWALAVGDLPFADARDAVVAHYRDSRDWIMPADVRKRVRAMRADRVARSLPAVPDHELADQPGRYLRAVREGVRRIADGFALTKAIEPPADRPFSDVVFTQRGKPRDLREVARDQAAEARAARLAREAAEGGKPAEGGDAA